MSEDPEADLVAALIDQQLNNRLSLDHGMSGGDLPRDRCSNPLCKQGWHGLPRPRNDYRNACPGSHLFNRDGTRIDE